LTVNHIPAADHTSAVADALNRNTSFDRAQVAWLMNEAYRWGYEARVDEENVAYPPASIFIAGEHFRDLDRQRYRAECDAAARLPRPGDFKGVGDQRVAA
jgi:hypothetical protein